MMDKGYIELVRLLLESAPAIPHQKVELQCPGSF